MKVKTTLLQVLIGVLLSACLGFPIENVSDSPALATDVIGISSSTTDSELKNTTFINLLENNAPPNKSSPVAKVFSKLDLGIDQLNSTSNQTQNSESQQLDQVEITTNGAENAHQSSGKNNLSGLIQNTTPFASPRSSNLSEPDKDKIHALQTSTGIYLDMEDEVGTTPEIEGKSSGRINTTVNNNFTVNGTDRDVFLNLVDDCQVESNTKANKEKTFSSTSKESSLSSNKTYFLPDYAGDDEDEGDDGFAVSKGRALKGLTSSKWNGCEEVTEPSDNIDIDTTTISNYYDNDNDEVKVNSVDSVEENLPIMSVTDKPKLVGNPYFEIVYDYEGYRERGCLQLHCL